MSTVFPGALDTFTNPLSTDKLNAPSHATQHTHSNDAVLALETKVGIDGSAVITTLDYLLRNSASSNPGHKHTLAAITDFPSQTGNNGKYLTTDGNTPSWGTVTVPGAANPTATIGLAAVNGVATTFLRSDGAPALSLAINPTWVPTSTSGHIFQAATSGKAAIFRAAGTTPDSITDWQDASAVSQLSVSPLGKIVAGTAARKALIFAVNDNGGTTVSNTVGTHELGLIYSTSGGGSVLYFLTGATSYAFTDSTGSAGHPVGVGDFTASGASVLSGQVVGSTVLTVKGATSQTANLQEWQNSSGTPLAFVTAAGVIETLAIQSYGSGTTLTVGGGNQNNLFLQAYNVISIGTSSSAPAIQINNMQGGGTPYGHVDINRPLAVAPGVAVLSFSDTYNPALTVTGAAHLTLPASTENIGANFNFSATKQWATGAITTQREVVFQAPTYAFVGASTITTAATVEITGAPVAGTNTTLTEAVALRIKTGADAAKGFVVRANSDSQSGTLWEAQDSAGNRLAKLTLGNTIANVNRSILTLIYREAGGGGTLVLDPLSTGGGTCVTMNSGSGVSGGIGINTSWGAFFGGHNGSGLVFSSGVIRPSDSSGNASDVGDVLGTSSHRFGPSYFTGLSLLNNTAGNVVLTVQGASSQSGNLTEWRDSSGGMLLAISPAGKIVASTANTAAVVTISCNDTGAPTAVSTNEIGFVRSSSMLQISTAAAAGFGFVTSGSAAYAPLATGALAVTGSATVVQETLGSAATTIRSVATNDDPTVTTYQNRVATTDATVTTLHAVTLTDETAYLITARVLARRTGGVAGAAGDSAIYERAVKAKRTGGGGAAIGAVKDIFTDEDQAGWDCTFDASSNDVRVRVTGAVDNAVTWHLLKIELSPLST